MKQKLHSLQYYLYRKFLVYRFSNLIHAIIQMTINWDCNKAPLATVIKTQCLHSSYIQKYAAIIAENRERVYADKLNMDAVDPPHVSAIPSS